MTIREIITIRALFIITVLVVVGASFSACGEEAPPVDQGPTEQEKLDRFAMADRRLREANSLSPQRKIEEYQFIAHALWDTPAGPEAWRFLIMELLKGETVDHAAVVRELEAFNRQIPSCRQLRHSAEIVTGSLEAAEGVGSEDEKEPSKQLLRSRQIWSETTDRFLKQESPKIEYFTWMGLARSRLSSRRIADADELMKSLQEGAPDMRVEHRFTVLMRRADLHRFELSQPASALELYRKAAALAPQLDLEMDEKWGEWVRRAIRELESSR